ncbi:MAG TPA: S8 family serine peptidase [Candidatus Limnocylindria bacterium]|nr:S8 family serine peptidase [Candidatus Limnocylindria bacterium]
MIPASRASTQPPRTAAPVSLVVKLPPDGSKAQLRSDIDQALGEDWRISRLFPPDPDKPELMRWFVVAGPLSLAENLAHGQAAWEAAHRLQRTGAYEIEPQVPKSTYAPVRASPRARAAAQPHLPGSSSKTWALEKARVLQAWQLPPRPGGQADGSGVVVGHPDTGYSRHPELYPASLDLDLDRDVVDADDDAQDPMRQGTVGHGTATGCVIAGRRAGQLAGVAPGATLRPIRAIIDVVVVFGGDVALAIDYARRTGSHVISMSLGGLFLGGVRDAVNAAVEDGCIVMAAAGNVWPWVVEPANYPSCIAVAATNANDQKWVDSASGHQVAVSAPGESVWTAVWRGGTADVERRSGTSYAVAHVAGIAALWLAHHGAETIRKRYGSGTSAAFRRLLTSTARTPTGWNSRSMGAGIVNAEALLSAPLPAARGLAPRRAPRRLQPTTARDALRDLSSRSAFDAISRAVERGSVPRRAEGRRAPPPPSPEADLLYREMVYLATEVPAVSASVRSAPRRARRDVPLLMSSLASPTLAELFAEA